MKTILAFLALGLSACTSALQVSCKEVQMVSVGAGFSPKDITLKTGQCVVFKNTDTQTHTAQAKPGTPQALAFSTSAINGGTSSNKVFFNLSGEVEYICGISGHESTMNGKITITAP